MKQSVLNSGVLACNNQRFQTKSSDDTSIKVTDAINLVDVANNFVEEKANRKRFFWYIFTERYPHNGVLFNEVNTNCSIVKNSVSI